MKDKGELVHFVTYPRLIKACNDCNLHFCAVSPPAQVAHCRALHSLYLQCSGLELCEYWCLRLDFALQGVAHGMQLHCFRNRAAVRQGIAGQCACSSLPA